MEKSIKTPLAMALGSSLFVSLLPTETQAETDSTLEKNPFSMTELSSGYMLTAKSDTPTKGKMKDGACGEGLCGAEMMKGAEEKTVEGNCAGNKPMPNMKKSDKKKEGKCGEGKCGSSM